MNNVTFLVSNKCNFRCKHCFANSGLKLNEELTNVEKYKAIARLKKIGTQKVVFSGGEPLLNNEILNLIQYAKNIGLKVGILTNGMLLSYKMINELQKYIDSLSISVYTNDILGFNKETYEKYLTKLTGTLINLTNSNIKFKITLPISQNNVKAIYNILELCIDKKIKPKTFRIYVITPVGRAKENIDICTEQVDFLKIMKRFPEKIKKSDLNIGIEQSSIDILSNYSQKCSKKCQIVEYEKIFLSQYADPHMDANGDLYLCGLLLRNEKYKIGNILKDTAQDIEAKTKNVAEKIKNMDKEDFCPMLNRKTEKGKQLVCPIIYIDQKEMQ